MKTLLFIGGTAFFGKLAVRKLIQSGTYRLTLLTRGTRPLEEWAASVTQIHCDRTDERALRAALAGKLFDVVVDNIANDGHDVGTILDILRGQMGHYLLCSSASVYPTWHTLHPWSESEAAPAPIPGQLPFANAKREAEQQLRESGTVPYTIVRPTVVEGPNDPVRRTEYFVQKLFKQERFVIPDDVILQHVFADDVADALVRLIDLGPTNRAYNICGNDRVPLMTYCAAIAALLNQPPRFDVVPRTDFMAVRAKEFPIFFDHTLLLSNALLSEAVHYEPTSIDRWLPMTVQWNRERLVVGY